ncbi:phosphodiester glycosidase family protein [Parapedobacter sp. 10938]|uniref:phosphodiester glycosidase family protein n=1 Tax=Parapedobacter flavus TaxID=3110225 RepID=UPI002DB55FB4|nr:phosphodiester glycosidase family protein [Parapedobacter sp. 10938]MEC3881760.1 phosphodiester glycosidase family protein [Parapedobacter sp. 10938]
MKRNLSLLVTAFLWFIQSASGQSPDSIAVATKTWNATVIDKGVVWKHGHFEELFGSRQDINFIEIDLRKHRRKIRIAADSVRLDSTSRIAGAHDAIVAINGGFFDVKNGGSVDFVKVGGEVVNPTRKPTDRASAVLLITKRKTEIRPASAIDYAHSQIPNVLLSGPLLLQDGAAAALSSNPFNNNRHPRSAIAITANRKLIFLVVDGRNRQSAGMNLIELTNVLRWLGADDAMNLDGGGSSTLYAKGATENGVVNHPSDNKQFDHFGQRKVANIIYVAD